MAGSASTSSVSVSKKYVSRKVKTVRWKPPSTSDFGDTHTFVSGSWDDSENVVAVWHVPGCEEDPTLIHQLSHPANVNDIQYVTREAFATAGGNGSVQLFQHNNNDQLESKATWNRIHTVLGGSAPCTALATNGDQIASVGEDGNLVILNPNQDQPVRRIESVGGCSMYAVVYVRASEVVTANMQGHLKLWDLRAQQPARATLLSPDQIAVCHLAGHPTQQHLVAAGGEDGAMAIWDMRNIAQPVTLISAHNGPITEVRFHPAAPDHLFTCGLDGQILHWDASASAQPTPVSFKGSREPSGASITVWLSSDVARGAIDTTCIIPQSPLPINSLDVEGPTLIAGSDNESIYTVRNVMLY
ncbi:nucleoporin Nup43-like [Penaeus japonicus]|uniref:nucleoporin Nup43-like n=1 Tax=Penaeus japonicus TaxID=27405 RepID=UPI001C70F970|nr:nucleoporin Nup43-like [Penaeus japonicus]